jgi:enoyl-CoA hydratase/carnithine racemase
LIEALDIAKKLSGRAPLALRQAKASVKAAFDLPHGTHLDLERQYFASLFATHDKIEGTTAFLARRPPIWTGS